MGRQCRSRYKTDLTNADWKAIRHFFPRQRLGRKRRTSIRRVVDALFYMVKTGCQWQYLPQSDFPPSGTVAYYFYKWREAGLWNRINLELVKLYRVQEGRDPIPSAAIFDAQTALTAEGGSDLGYDGGKKTSGRKRQFLVDVLGNLLMVKVHAANIHDAKGGSTLLDNAAAAFPRLTKVWADGGYAGDLVTSLRLKHRITLEIVKSLKSRVKNVEQAAIAAPRLFSTQLDLFRPGKLARTRRMSSRDEERGFKIVAWRWIVERTIGWISRFRRLRVDYEHSPASSETWCLIAQSRMTLTRLE